MVALVAGFARPAEASCSAPATCWVREARVEGCEVIDAAAQPAIQAHLAAVDPRERRATTKAYLRAYSGVYLEVTVERSTAVKCTSARGGDELRAHPFAPAGHGDKRAAFFAGGVDKSCAAYPAGKALRVREAVSCCDGAAEAPCLYHGFGGAGGLVHARGPGAPAAGEWVPAGRTRDDTAAIHLRRTFGKKSGTFKAEPESMLDRTPTVSGEFLVGTYRFAYDQPISELGVKFDELIVVELLDCRRSYFGTLERRRRLRGQPVDEEITKDADVLMTQVTIPTVDAQLCDVHDGKPPRKLPR